MNAAIIFIKNEFEANLAKAKYLDSNLLNDLLIKLKQTSLDKLYLVKATVEDEDVVCVNNIKEAIDDIEGYDGKTLLISPFYPLLKSYHFEALLNEDEDGVALSEVSRNIINVFKLNNDVLKKYETITYKDLEVESTSTKKIENYVDLERFSKDRRVEINTRLLSDGVNILDVEDTYIGLNVEIEAGATIYPNVYIEGKSIIKKNSVITSGCFLIDAEIGENTTIINSRIDASIVHDNVTVGPNSHLRGHSEVFDGARVGNFVEFKNTKFGKGSKCAHLTYLGDSVVGEGVNIGCGVVTVNYDGTHKFATIIKDHAFIGSNANLIAPITIGEYSVVAAGSTCTQDVENKSMAIARPRQTNKEGYGYKYIKKEK